MSYKKQLKKLRDYDKIYVKYIPKHVILYELWQKADYIYENKTELTLSQACEDIKYMTEMQDLDNITVYRNKNIHIDLTSDTIDLFMYCMHNDLNVSDVKKSINIIKEQYIRKAILTYVKF